MSAADKKARMLARAAKQTQKPIAQPTLTSTHQPHHQQAMQQQTQAQAAQQQQQAADGSDRMHASPSPSATAAAAAAAAAPAAAPASLGYGYGTQSYTDDMDDMDATLYLDRDMDRMKLKNKAQLGAQPASRVAMQQQANPKQYAAARASQRGAASPQRASGPWEDQVQSFDAHSPSAAERARGSNGAYTHSPSSSPRVTTGAVTVLDSAAEERRLDAIRRKERFDDSVSEGADYPQTNSVSASPTAASAAAAAAASSSAAAQQAAAGWVDPQTRLQQVQVRAAPERGAGGGDGGPEDEDFSQDASEGGAAGQAIQQATEQEDLEKGDQPYQRAMQQRMLIKQQQEAAAAAASAAGSAASSPGATQHHAGDSAGDAQLAAYQRQLQLQAEAAADLQRRGDRGELTSEEQRAAVMRQKRPPLILDWSSLDTRAFFQSTPPRGGWVQCRLIKRSGGFSSFLHPRYELYTEEHQGGLFLATARKSSKTKPNYHLSTERLGSGAQDKSIAKTSEHYAGKVAATLSRSDYVVYDDGFNAGKSGDASHSQRAREELANISYKPHLSGKTPRKLAVLLPILFADSHKDAFVAKEFKNEFLSGSQAYQHLWKQLQDAQQRARVPRAWLCLLNKPPRYHADTGQYVLDFCGRAPQVSVKNFQLVYPEEPDEVLFQLGRLDDDNFSVDFRFPMAPIQAFAIALSSLDYKWTVD